MAEATPIKPEIRVLAESGFIFPPTSVSVYLVTPYSFAESIFLYLIRERLAVDKTDILVLSHWEDFDTILRTSSVKTPLVRSFLDLFDEPLIHYRYCESMEEVVRRFELHYRNNDFIYIYLGDPSSTVDDKWLDAISGFVTKVRNNVTRRFLLTLFVDEGIGKTAKGKRILYAADNVFKLEEEPMISGGKLHILKAKMYVKPPLNIEYTVSTSGIDFQILRALR